jgi:hypothetical protein
MTDDVSRGEKPLQSKSLINQKMPNSTLLAAVSVLSASLGVTAAQAAGETKIEAGAAREFGRKVAETQSTTQKKTVKTNIPVNPKDSNQVKWGTGPGPAVLPNPHPLPPSEGGPNK